MLDASGDLLEPQTNHPLLIQGSDLVWIVRSGKLDIFVVGVVHGEVASARQHVVRIEEGHPVFGMSLIDESGVSIIAVATPGTQLLCFSQTRLRELSLSLDLDVAADVGSLLEDWISRLGAVASGGPPPKFFTELKAGATLEVANEAKPIMPVDGIMWIKHLQGTSRFLNMPEIDPIGDREYFPVSKNGWLQPQLQSRIVSLPTHEWARNDAGWQSLQAFHQTFLQCLIFKRRVQEDKHRKRLRVQADSEAAVIRGAVRALAWPLQEKGGAPIPDEAGFKNPVLLACEAVGKYLGLKVISSPEIRSGMSLRDPVASIARASALRHRVVALKGKWWVDASGPLVAFRDSDNRPLALLPGPQKVYNLYDPVEDTTIAVSATVALSLNAFAYSFYRPLPNRKLSLWDLLAFGLPASRRELTMIVFLGIGGGLLGLAFPIAMGIIFNSFIPSAERTQLLQMSGFLVIATLAGSMFALARSSAALRLAGKLGASVQAAVWDRLLRLPVRFFRLYTSGDLAERSLGIEYILRMLTGSALASILSGVFSIFSFLLLFYYSWQLAIVAAGLMLIAFAVSAICAVCQVRYQRRIVRLRGRIAGMLLQFADNIAKLHVSGAEPRAFAVWAREFATQKELSIRAQNVTNYLTVFNSAFPVISLVAIFSYATHLMGHPLLDVLTTGTFLAFLAAFVQFQSAALQFNSTVESVLGIVPIYERVAPIFEAVPEVDEARKHPGELSGALEISHLSFRYHQDAPLVLRDLSLVVKPGEFVAIVGPSGSGKSTLLRLLLGFEKSDSGAIYYDGGDLAGLDIQAVRQQIGVVIQNARLGAGSIFENIVGSAPLTLDDAWQAAQWAGLDEDIHKMPMGMHTFISEGGRNLSGGQRQRLHIARALVKKPRLFFFDEATSALDNQTQLVVSRSLDALRATRVVIAHRLSTIVNAERILVIHKGTVVQSGCYEELINREGLFRELAKRQLN